MHVFKIDNLLTIMDIKQHVNDKIRCLEKPSPRGIDVNETCSAWPKTYILDASGKLCYLI